LVAVFFGFDFGSAFDNRFVGFLLDDFCDLASVSE
jgi:hypothetical protein